MLKHRRPGRSGVCVLSSARWLWHLERFSARLPPKSYQYLAKLTVREPCRSFKARARHTLKVRRCPPPRRPARARRARAASRPPPRRPGTTTRRDAVCCCGRAGHGSAHVTAGTDVPARSALSRPATVHSGAASAALFSTRDNLGLVSSLDPDLHPVPPHGTSKTRSPTPLLRRTMSC